MWTPDFCKCKRIIEEDEMGIATQVDFEQQEICDAHLGLGDALYDTLLKESQLRSYTMEALRLADPSLSTKTENGDDVPDLEKINCTFDEDRNLIIDLPTLDPKQKMAALLNIDISPNTLIL